MNVSTLSPKKSKDKEGYKGMTGDLADKDENSVDKKDKSTHIVNIEDLDSDDVPISQRLAPGIAKRLNNRKGQVIEPSSTPSKYLGKRDSLAQQNDGTRLLLMFLRINPLRGRIFHLSLVIMTMILNILFRTSSLLPESKHLGRRFQQIFLKFQLTTFSFTL